MQYYIDAINHNNKKFVINNLFNRIGAEKNGDIDITNLKYVLSAIEQTNNLNMFYYLTTLHDIKYNYLCLKFAFRHNVVKTTTNAFQNVQICDKKAMYQLLKNAFINNLNNDIKYILDHGNHFNYAVSKLYDKFNTRCMMRCSSSAIIFKHPNCLNAIQKYNYYPQVHLSKLECITFKYNTDQAITTFLIIWQFYSQNLMVKFISRDIIKIIIKNIWKSRYISDLWFGIKFIKI